MINKGGQTHSVSLSHIFHNVLEDVIASFNRKPRGKSDSKENRINDEITGSQVRLVSDGEPAVISLTDALAKAQEEGLDLVEISATQDIPVVRIMDYSKYRFEQVKKAKRSEKKAESDSCQGSQGSSGH